MLVLLTVIPRRCRSLGCSVGLVGALVVVMVSAPVPAQPRGPEAGSHIEALVHMRQAQAAIRRGDLTDAIALYEQAATEGAPAAVYRELAFVLESASRTREAARQWTRYASAASTPDERQEAFDRAESLRRRMSAIRVRVSPPMAARRARVWFDHEAPRFYQAGGLEMVLEGGTHRVRVESPGYQVFEAMVTTGYGETLDVPVVVAPLPVGAADAGATLPRAPAQ
jgi:hypothetical protein